MNTKIYHIALLPVVLAAFTATAFASNTSSSGGYHESYDDLDILMAVNTASDSSLYTGTNYTYSEGYNDLDIIYDYRSNVPVSPE